MKAGVAMTLIRRPECSNESSDQAFTCPRGGRQIRIKTLYGYEYKIAHAF
jgi:hypothetical protein